MYACLKDPDNVIHIVDVCQVSRNNKYRYYYVACDLTMRNRITLGDKIISRYTFFALDSLIPQVCKDCVRYSAYEMGGIKRNRGKLFLRLVDTFNRITGKVDYQKLVYYSEINRYRNSPHRCKSFLMYRNSHGTKHR